MKSDIVKLRHERSQKEYPQLALEDDEFVELVINRSKVGIYWIWAVVVMAVLAVAASITVLALNPGLVTMNATARNYLLMLLVVVALIFVVMGAVLSYVYKRNHMYVTNHRIIKFATTTLFAHSKNVINLVSVEDVSFQQNTILQHLFNYGTIRLSTVGDETTYTFTFVDTPTDELDTISHLVHVAKEEDPTPVSRG